MEFSLSPIPKQMRDHTPLDCYEILYPDGTSQKFDNGTETVEALRKVPKKLSQSLTILYSPRGEKEMAAKTEGLNTKLGNLGTQIMTRLWAGRPYVFIKGHRADFITLDELQNGQFLA